VRKEIGSWIVELIEKNKLGEGGMGEVYLARHNTLGSLAAIKLLPPALTNDQEFSKRFFEEAKTQARLKHSYIAQVIDCIAENGQLFLVMEYLEGGTLADVIEKNKSGIEEKQALKWIKQVLDALNYAHQNGVIHRDIKPTNIMLDKHRDAKVLDFGIALEMTADRKTKTGVSIGTPHYMSPEQIRTPKRVDHRIDVYSTSIVLYEMLTGKVPFDGNSDFDIREAQVRNNPLPLKQLNPNISPELEEIVLKGLAKDPNQRYSGCGEFLQVIENYEKTSQANLTPFPPNMSNNSKMNLKEEASEYKKGSAWIIKKLTDWGFIGNRKYFPLIQKLVIRELFILGIVSLVFALIAATVFSATTEYERRGGGPFEVFLFGIFVLLAILLLPFHRWFVYKYMVSILIDKGINKEVVQKRGYIVFIIKLILIRIITLYTIMLPVVIFDLILSRIMPFPSATQDPLLAILGIAVVVSCFVLVFFISFYFIINRTVTKDTREKFGK